MTPVSPFTYMGHERFRQICRQHGAQINLRVMDLGKVFPVSGGLRTEGSTTAATCVPHDGTEALARVSRRCRSISSRSSSRCRSKPAATLILAVLARHGVEAALDVAGDCLRAIWAEDRDISAAHYAAAKSSRHAGLTPKRLLAQAASAEVAALYILHSQEAIARGVFGAPTYVLKDELFWGQDRLDFLDRALARA